MAKIMVAINIPNVDYETLKKEIIDNPKKGNCDGCWFSEEDGDKIIIDGAYLETSYVDDSCFTFELIGVRP